MKKLDMYCYLCGCYYSNSPGAFPVTAGTLTICPKCSIKRKKQKEDVKKIKEIAKKAKE